MKKALITILVVAIVIGGFALWFLTRDHTGDEGVEESGAAKVEAAGEEYYEPDYIDGNDSTTLGGLTYSLPDSFVGILSEDDSVI